MNPLLSQLKKYGNIDAEIETELNGKIKFLAKKKGEFWLKEGQVVSNLFVLEKGLVRAFYNAPGREIDVWFGFEDGVLGSVMPLFFNQPSIENIQFLEDSTLYYLSASDLENLYKSSQEMNTIGRRIAEEYCKILEERSFLLQTHTAEQRYNSLLKNQPEALKRIALGHISSYLGISQETLSRIRKRS